MPVRSYIAIPMNGQKERMTQEINQLKGCETAPSDNKDVIVVLTETETNEEDSQLHEQLKNLESVQDLMLVSAFAE